MKVAVRTTGRVMSCKQALLAGLLCLLSGIVCAQPQAPASPAEQRAKAVTEVVLGILSYARWPVEPDRLRLCVIGPTEYTDDLLKGTTQATGRPVTVRRLLASNPTIADECDAAYIGKLTVEERSHLYAALTGRPVLSISESDDQCTVGSLFCLRVSDEQVSFEVNLDSVARSGVRIHPSVLQLSRRKPAAT
ncbi:YfiR family protein [Pseudomonas sp. REP124]|uniref:YfiR family protein n=1 Tax=Pseudomonas sp. REP124 TaxID=2875731 RepID=UPI001CCC9BAD|nr:YfiR family protein [Pseudomonas sp. REP124]MBZ9784772.1 YfiR family protein [Pseudomonas sp. REP124]